MHPYLTSSVASEHRADLRRAADAWRLRHGPPPSGRAHRRTVRLPGARRILGVDRFSGLEDR